MTQSIQPPPNYRSAGSVSTLTAPSPLLPGIAENTALSYVVPANSLAVGTMFRLDVMGRMTAPSATATLTWRLKMGAVTLATVVTTPGAITAGLAFFTKCFAVCTANGVSGRFNGGVISELQAAAAAQQHIGNVPGASASNIDTTLSQTIALTYQWSVAPASGGFAVELGTLNLERL